nr:hypothetical protein [Lentilactobacillus otakiensis]
MTKLQSAVENKDDNIDEYKVVTTTEKPADNILVYEHVGKEYFEVGQGPSNAETVVAVEEDGKYYTYAEDENGQPVYTEITDEYLEAKEKAQTIRATTDLATIKARMKQPKRTELC